MGMPKETVHVMHITENKYRKEEAVGRENEPVKP